MTDTSQTVEGRDFNRLMLAVYAADLPHATKYVALRIAWRQGENGWCSLSARQLAEDCAIVETTAERAIARLVAGGWLESKPGPALRPGRPSKLRRLVVPAEFPRVAVRGNVSPQGCEGKPGVSPQDAPSFPAAEEEFPRSKGRVSPQSSAGHKNKRSQDLQDQHPPPSASARGPSPSDRIKELEARYPADLVTETRDGCALARRNAKMSDGRWLATLERLDKLPADAVIEAMRTFVDRYADGERDERYLEGIARRVAKDGPRTLNGLPARGALPPAKIDPESARRSLEYANSIWESDKLTPASALARLGRPRKTDRLPPGTGAGFPECDIDVGGCGLD